MVEHKQRRVNLYCPSLAKITQFVACDDHKLDLGCIARAFGLDPSTLKINGHFISRGADFVASSVTWKSLLSFFSSKGFSTGKHAKDAIFVHGKLSKPGTKRAHICEDAESGIFHVGVKGDTELRHGENILVGNKKLKLSNSGGQDPFRNISRTRFTCSYVGNGMKRAREDEATVASSCKKIRSYHEDVSVQF